MLAVVGTVTYHFDEVATDPNTTRVCDQNTLTHIVRFLDSTPLPSTDAACKTAVAANPNFTLAFERALWENVNIDAGSVPTDDLLWAEDRGLTPPTFGSCNQAKTYCPPGPCRFFDMDYQYEDDHTANRNSVLHTADKASTPWPMKGVPRCGARFGLQMINKQLKQTKPATIDPQTLDIFFIPTDPVLLYGPETQKCPVAFWAGVNSNLNPLWYYKNELYRRYNQPKAMTPNYCTKPLPPPGSRATADGMAWGTNPFSWGKAEDVSNLQKAGTTMFGSGVGNTYQHGMYDNLDEDVASRVRNFSPAYSASDATVNKWPALAFSVPQMIPVNASPGFTIDDAHSMIDYENKICDLTQCAWAPTETRGEKQQWAATNCMMAEMLQWYASHAEESAAIQSWLSDQTRALPGNNKCWTGCIPKKANRNRMSLKNAKHRCCTGKTSPHYTDKCPGSFWRCGSPSDTTTAVTKWEDLFSAVPAFTATGSHLGEHFPLMCFKKFPSVKERNGTPLRQFKAGSVPNALQDAEDSIPDAWNQIAMGTNAGGLANVLCRDGTTFDTLLHQLYTASATASSHANKVYVRLEDGIPAVWGCQPKQVFEGDSNAAKTRRTRRQNSKRHAEQQRNLVQSMKGNPYSALMHPNYNNGWADVGTGVNCNGALQSGEKANADLNHTGCGFIANTMHTYTQKLDDDVNDLYGKYWATALACTLGTSRKPLLDVGYSIKNKKHQSLLKILMDAGVAAADMNIDSWAFIMDIPEDASEKEASTFEPVEWAVSGGNQWVPADTVANASFPNSAILQQTEACNCGGARPIYRTLGTVWNEVKRIEYQPLLTKPNWTDQLGPTKNVMVIEGGYGWNTNVEGQANEQPIGLQIPSNPLYTPDLILVERDILQPKTTTIEPQQLVEDYFTSPNAPNKKNLDELLYKAERNRADHRYTEHRIRFQYGSCMRFPYGQLPRMSMQTDAQNRLFKPDNTTFDADYWVGSESQMGYCELFGPDKQQYAFCLADGYSMSKRVEFCSKPKATHVVLGLGLRDRGFSDICNVAQKVCWIIPGTPGWETINLVISGPSAPIGVLENYTVLIAPFNWTVAAGMLAPNRYVYEVGGPINPEPLDDADTARFGMRAMKVDTFAQLRSTTGSVDDILKATADIYDILLGTCHNKDGTKCDLSTFGWGKSVSLDTAYTPILESGIRVNHAGMTIASSDGSPLRFARAGALAATTRACTVFYVAAARFSTNLDFRILTGCTHMPPLDRTAVVFGGSDVGGADITLTTVGVEMPVAFMGDDTMSFTQTSDCWLGVSTVRVSGPDIQYAAGLARASGELVVHSEDPALRVLIQPRRSDNLTLNRPVINISAYTNIFGDPFMSHVYSEHLALYNRLVLPLFVVLVAIITGGVVLLGVHFARILKE
jgi:hypothetical protein